MSSAMSQLRVCRAGHVVHYPAALEDVANRGESELIFATMCECGKVHLVAVWAGDGAKLAATGGAELHDRFEDTDWAEDVTEDGFIYRAVPHPLDITLFLRGLEEDGVTLDYVG